MKLLLRRTLEHVGNIGDIVDVSDGFGRNYLLAQRLAVPVTPDNRRLIEIEKIVEAKRDAERKAAAEQLARSIEGVDVEVVVKAQDDGTLYGSVTPKEIVERLKATREIAVEPKQLKIGEPMKKVGDYEVQVKLHPEVIATFKVHVTREPTDEEE